MIQNYVPKGVRVQVSFQVKMIMLIKKEKIKELRKEYTYAQVVELVDTHDLKSCGRMSRESSILSLSTNEGIAQLDRAMDF